MRAPALTLDGNSDMQGWIDTELERTAWQARAETWRQIAERPRASHGYVWLGLGAMAGVAIGVVGTVALLGRDWRGVAAAGGLVLVISGGAVVWWQLERPRQR